MPVKGGTRDHEMSWLLFEAADSRMMLVKKTKQPKCPKRKPPRNPPAKIKPPSASVTTIPPSNNQQQLSPNPVPVQTAPVPTFDPPPPYPYSTGPPKDVLPRQVAPSGAPPTLPPRPPKIPLLPAPQASTPALARNGLRPLERILNEASYSETSKDLANSPANLPSLEIEPFEDRSGQLISARELEHLISSKLDAVLTSIDGEAFSGNESELDIYEPPPAGLRGGWGSASRQVSYSANRAITSSIIGTNYFKKANLYANSKLPHNLPELKLYMPSYPLLCLAAQYSQRVYTKPAGKEKEAHVDANFRMGTKAMVIKSVPIDDMNTIVFAIRGSQTFMDWAVNLNAAPVAPDGFLDDPGNLCHSGFLTVARRMLPLVSSRLRQLLQENPSRSTSSLLITGHSAGGAVASLLYAHMLSTSISSELTLLTNCFKRIHCLTFGTPPVSLLPLTKPTTERMKKSLFLSFINEGDPVPRADKAYIRSLLRLYASPAPPAPSAAEQKFLPQPPPSSSSSSPPKPKCALPFKRPKAARAQSAPAAPQYVWKVPPGTLSNAGRLVVLRGEGAGGQENVRAQVTCDEELRGVVFGDPVMHMMKIYARRIEVLATKAVTAKIWG